MPTVSVVMAVHNGAQFLMEAVDSILSQTMTDLELIIVDDASTDGSLKLLRSVRDPRVRLITHETNMGASLSRNDAMEAAQGRYIAIMDADDVAAPNRLELQVATLDDTPALGLVGAAIYDNIDEDGMVLFTSQLPRDDGTIRRTLVERWCFLHPSIMFRQSLLRQVGGYRREFELAEDHDFILRLVAHCEAVNLNEKLVKYRVNPRGLSVRGHRHLDALGRAAMHMARNRQNGRNDDPIDLQKLAALKCPDKATEVGISAARRWQESLYAANRYYGFGCRALYAGNRHQARRCFVRSLRTNACFVKSWVCLLLTWSKSLASASKPMFRDSKLYYDELQSVAHEVHQSEPPVTSREARTTSDAS